MLIETCSLGRMEEDEKEGGIRREVEGLNGLSFTFKELEICPPIGLVYI